MTSVACGGAADRIAERTLFKVLRAGSGTPARYSSTFVGAPLAFATERRVPDFPCFMRAMLREPPLQVQARSRGYISFFTSRFAFFASRSVPSLQELSECSL